MPRNLKRYQHSRTLHFITFSCYRRARLLGTAAARDLFEAQLERVRKWYDFFITGYVVMPEHVHLLVSEPERGSLAVAIQMLKQIVSRKLRKPDGPAFWYRRYYDFPVWSDKKRIEKPRYIHRNPARIGITSGRLEVEQFWPLGYRLRRDCRDRVSVDGAQTRTNGLDTEARPQMNPHPPPKPGGRVGQPHCFVSGAQRALTVSDSVRSEPA